MKSPVVVANSAQHVWTTRGFDAFRRGTFGNAGQNLYVSRAGVLQRIHQYDVNADGHVDLLFCNSQNHWESPPAYGYWWNGSAFDRYEIPVIGANCATIADLNGDGAPDLILGPWYEGIGFDINAIVYYGNLAHGANWGEHALQYLPAPLSFSVAAGDFNGDGRVDLAFQCREHLKVFRQSDLGFEPKQFIDLPIKAARIAAADVDGDGFCDIVARFADGQIRIYWGSPDGLDASRWTAIAAPGDVPPIEDSNQPSSQLYVEWVEDALPLPKVLTIKGRTHVFVARERCAWLIPFDGSRSAGQAIRIDCANALSAAAADLDGDGHADLVVACRDDSKGDGEVSWIYWGSSEGKFSNDARTHLPTRRACDVAIGRFDGQHACIAFAQRFHDGEFTVPTLVYRALEHRRFELWQQLEAHDAPLVFAVPRGDGRGDELLVINRQGRNKHGDIPAFLYLGGPDGFSPQRRLELAGFGSCVGVCADLNDDGHVDVALANAAENAVDLDPGSYVHLNSTRGFPEAPAQVLPTKRAHGVACADLDRDGWLDLIFAGFNNDELLIFRGGPNGFDTDNPTRIRLEIEGVVYKEPRFIYLADLNGDGWLDLVIPEVTSAHSFILWGGPDGFSMQRHQKLNTPRTCGCRAADLDGDGYLDLIMGGHLASPTGPHDSFVYIYWNGPDGLREDRRTLLPSEGVNSISVADFNNDGHLDLFVGSYGDGRKRRDIDSYIYWNTGGRGFSARHFTRLFTHSASGDFAADFNEDGWIDLAVANHKAYGDHGAESMVWWNGPDGFSDRQTTWLPTNGPHGMQMPAHGNIMDRSEEEHYISEPRALPQDTRVDRVEWDATLGPKTWVRATVRLAPTEGELEGAPWIEIDRAREHAAGGWMQYRLSLGARNCGSTPRVTEVRVHFSKS